LSNQTPAETWTETGDAAHLTKVVNKPVKTLEQLYRVCEVDTKEWECKTFKCRAWTTGMKLKVKTGTVDKKPVYEHRKDFIQNYLVSATLTRKTPRDKSLQLLLQEIAASKLKLPTYNRPAIRSAVRRALEVSVLDPHVGLKCFAPQSDHTWSFGQCEQAFMSTVESLLDLAKVHGPFEEIVVPFGNDFLHADNLLGTTTAGTPQPESQSLAEAYLRAEKLGLWLVDRLRQIAPVIVKAVPGNHDYVTSFTLARLIKAFYDGAKAKDVTVDASPAPYKFYQYGTTLIGYDHGQAISPIRLASLMANETRRTGWAEAGYCEWHLGDQHRKASSKPSTFEEQGVSVEYLPGLTPANEWHKKHGYNWQKRGGTAFVYDRAAGPIARYQVNFDGYTGKQLGAA
jgi:hypothetical protein